MLPDIRSIQQWTLRLYIAGMVIAIPLFLGYAYPIPIPYAWLKIIHISGVIMFMGNIIIGPLWIIYALNSKDNKIIHFAMKTICWADIFFSIPGIVLTLISGLMLAPVYGGYDKQPWMLASLILLALSGIPAVPTLRAQYKLYRLSYEATIENKLLEDDFKNAMQVWSVWGTIAIILPFISFVLMVIKPVLW